MKIISGFICILRNLVNSTTTRYLNFTEHNYCNDEIGISFICCCCWREKKITFRRPSLLVVFFGFFVINFIHSSSSSSRYLQKWFFHSFNGMCVCLCWDKKTSTLLNNTKFSFVYLFICFKNFSSSAKQTEFLNSSFTLHHEMFI